jgi:hypothetical protein
MVAGIPQSLLERMKKLAKKRNHSLNDELVEAIISHILGEQERLGISFKTPDKEPSIKGLLSKAEFQKIEEMVLAEAIKNHLAKHEQSAK